MKAITALAWLFCLLVLPAAAQQKVIEKTMAVPSNKKVDLRFGMGNNIKVTAWDRKDVSIKMSYMINGGRLNDAVEPVFTAENGVARLDVKFDHEKLKEGQSTDCPEDQNYSYYRNNDKAVYTCHVITYEVFVPRDADLDVESVHGSIELIGLTGPVQAKAIHGFVDMSWPAKKGAELTFISAHGDVFSDQDIKFSGNKSQHRVTGLLNGGGIPISLEATHSNVYFRKQK